MPCKISFSYPRTGLLRLSEYCMPAGVKHGTTPGVDVIGAMATFCDVPVKGVNEGIADVVVGAGELLRLAVWL